MYKILFAIAALVSSWSVQAADVGVSVSIGQPGFYGQINIGNYGQPALMYPQPVIISPARPGMAPGRPLYLRVPPGHAKDWSKHCHRYNACANQVYFVQDSWYNDVVVPRHRDDHPGKGRGHDKGRDKGHDNGHDRGKGNGKGKGHD